MIQQRDAATGQAKTRERGQAGPLPIAQPDRRDWPCHRGHAEQHSRRAGDH